MITDRSVLPLITERSICRYIYIYIYIYILYSLYIYTPRDVFLTAGARAYQKHVLHGPETVSIFVDGAPDSIIIILQ